MRKSRVHALVLAAVSTFVATCGGGSGSPSASTPATPGTSTGSSSPSTPVTQPPVAATNLCDRLGYVKDNGNCRGDSPTFLGQVDQAIDELAKEQPGIFDVNDQQGAGGYRVISSGQYYVGLINKLNGMGLCAGFDGEELQVKDNNSFSDQYHVLTSKGYARRGIASYRVTCFPAAFPVEPPPFAGGNGCSLPDSREVACGRETPAFLGDVEAAIDQVARQHPDALDNTRARPGSEDFWKIVDNGKFIQYMTEAMKAKGYCARFDGEELVVKKANKVSEHYDIETSDGYVRRGDGAYRSSCYPAAF
jgi:hypothetical protein